MDERQKGKKEGRKMGEERREEGRIEELDETVMYSLYVLSAIPFVFGTFFYVLRTLFLFFIVLQLEMG